MTVEMEAAALMAVARYRGVRLAQVLYAGDDLAGPVWDNRGWATATSVREGLFWHAADACLRLGDAPRTVTDAPGARRTADGHRPNQ